MFILVLMRVGHCAGSNELKQYDENSLTFIIQRLLLIVLKKKDCCSLNFLVISFSLNKDKCNLESIILIVFFFNLCVKDIQFESF